MTSTILHFALAAAELRDYGHCRELLAGLSDEELRSAHTTALAFAAQCNVVLHRVLEPVPAGVDGYAIGGATR